MAVSTQPCPLTCKNDRNGYAPAFHSICNKDFTVMFPCWNKDFFGYPSGFLRVLVGYALSDTRRIPEGYPNKARQSPGGINMSTRLSCTKMTYTRSRTDSTLK